MPDTVEMPGFDTATQDAGEVTDRVGKLLSWAHGAGKLPIFVVYDHPADMPGSWVVRMFLDNRPTDFHYSGTELEHVRGPMRSHGLACLGPDPKDQKQIHETWL